MADTRWQRTWEIFHEALELEPEARAAYLASACGEDAALMKEVAGLLGALDGDGAFLETPAAWFGGAGTIDQLEPGTRVGPYLIRRVIGSGGMGVVYEADHDGDIERRVALKLIRSGMESREILARFALERRSLALMNHPNIATAYDVGVSADGRPYFAMEFIDGAPLTHFCDEQMLTIGERLELFLQICDAIQHAHQKAILHRDLKPSNVLAGRDGERTILKVIDFGVAKATGPRADRRSFVTQIGRFIGTPEYMSPEQAGVANLDVDTRADVYSLGVMLYELLAGVLPIDPERLRSASFAEIERVLFTEDLPRPSRRVAMLEQRQEVAERRRLTAATLERRLRGDLDWIVARAMERDRARRYQSVSEFAADIRRYLAHEPVVAGPPDLGYRIGKFVRRHRAGAAAAVVALLVTAGFIASLILSNARTQRALQEADVERERSNEVSSFLLNLFRVSKPSTAEANATTARELLDKGAADIRARLKDQPVVQARLMETMGEVYTNLGLLDQAEALLADSLDVRRRALGANHPEVALTLARLGRVHMSQGKYQDALARHREALAIYRRGTPVDLDSVSTALLNEGAALRALGQVDEAEKSLQESIAIRTQQLHMQDVGVAEAVQNLGGIALSRGDLSAAERYRRQAADLRLQLLGEGHIDVARARNDLAVVLYQKGDDAGAELLFRQVLATYLAVLGEDHAEVATTKNNLGAALRRQGKLAEAETLARDAVEIRRRLSGPDHPELAVALNNLALLMRAKGDPAAGVPMLREALTIMRKAYGDGHPSVTATLANLGELLHETHAADAESTLEEALSQRRKALKPGHANIAASMSALAHARAERGDTRAVEPMLREALAALEKTLPADNPRVIQAKAYLGGALVDLGQREEGETLLRASQAALAKGGSQHDRDYVTRQLAAKNPRK
jgi:serine/threonine protein kinase